MFRAGSIMLFLILLVMFIVEPMFAGEDTSRRKIPAWEIKYWGNDNRGFTFEETRGRYGVVFFCPISRIVYAEGSDKRMTEQIKNWETKQNRAQREYLGHGLYFQIITYGGYRGNSNEKEFRELVKQFKIHLPVGTVEYSFWEELGLRVEKMSWPGAFLVDPYGRIASRTKLRQRFGELQLLPFEQMTREVAEYWMETAAKDIARADKAFEKKKWQDAYKIYRPLAAKVKAVPAGLVIAERTEMIEKQVRADIMDNLSILNAGNTEKIIPALKKIGRAYKGTVLAEEAARYAAVLKRVKKDPELIIFVRLHTANTLVRQGREDEAKAIYQGLADSSEASENLLAELDLRIAGENAGTVEWRLNPGDSCEEWLERAGGFYARAVQLIEADPTEAARQGEAVALLMAASEYYTAAVACAENELPGIREKLAATRSRIFWLAGRDE
ncbi:hypothetical protein ACFL54_04680 [Planctomycetota bacterium]